MTADQKPAYVPIAPDTSSFKNAIAIHSIGEDLEVMIYGSLGLTLDTAEREINNKQVVNAYRFLSGDERLDFSMVAARKVVLYEVQSAWYEANGKDIPQSVMSQQELTLREAMVATKAKDEAAAAAGATKTKEPRVTVKSIIEAGLRAGTSNEEILKQVKAKFPEGKADDSHVRYYRHFLVKAGELEKLPRPTKPKAEKAQKTLTEAAKPDAPKATGSKPAKATKSKGATAK